MSFFVAIMYLKRELAASTVHRRRAILNLRCGVPNDSQNRWGALASSSLVTRSKDIREDVLFLVLLRHRAIVSKVLCGIVAKRDRALPGRVRAVCPAPRTSEKTSFFSIVKASGNRVKGFKRYRCEKGLGTARASSSCVPRSKDV